MGCSRSWRTAQAQAAALHSRNACRKRPGEGASTETCVLVVRLFKEVGEGAISAAPDCTAVSVPDGCHDNCNGRRRITHAVATMAGLPGCAMEAVSTLEPHVVVLDDDESLRALVSEYLADNEMRVTEASTAQELTDAMARDVVDCVVLDLRLPGDDGMRIARRLRDLSAVPILMLTGRRDEADRVMGLEIGADDYLTKPFGLRELLARIRALLRRAQAQQTVADALARVRAYRFGGWELNVGLRRLRAATGEAVPLTNGEFSLLTAFLSSPRRVLTRDQLLELSRLHNAEVYDRSIDVQILRLRRKIESDPSHPEYIRTERGVGYVFDKAVQAMR
jgi:DNA-binding response OmpR family regulator